jgi:uncharacterized protein (DUF58 family)
MIPDEVTHELRYIEVSTVKKIRSHRVGPYQSAVRGAGFDFDEHQLYRPGDDVRRIDWNVTARMGVPYVRHTHADREMNVMIAMDASRSMALGTAKYSKKEVMTFITGSLLFSCLADSINVGFLAFGDKVLTSTVPRRTRAAAWSVLEQCWSLASTAPRTLMLPMIQHLNNTLKRMSVVFIVSDFRTDDDVLESRELARLASRHDVIAVVPEDRSETMLPPGQGYVRVRDLESGREATLGLGARNRRAYTEAARARREALTRAFYHVPMDHVFVPTDENPLVRVMSLFSQRMHA